MQLVARNWFRGRFARPARNSDEHGVRVRVVEAVRQRPQARRAAVACRVVSVSCPGRQASARGRETRVASVQRLRNV